MKILLFGSTGQLGRSILRANALSPAPHDILTPSRQKLDLVRIDQISSNLKNVSFDILVNCTGFHDVDRVEVEPKLGFTVNAYAVQELARACARQEARMIHISTDFVFGGDELNSSPLTENDPVAPVNAYGTTKFLGERLASCTHQNIIILRVASLFGLGGMSQTQSNFVEAILAKAGEGREFQVVDDQTASPTSTEDVASAILALLHHDSVSGIYHVVNSGLTTKFGFAQEILRQAKLPDLIKPCASTAYPTAAKRPKFSALDNQQFCSTVWHIPPWQDALARYLSEWCLT